MYSVELDGLVYLGNSFSLTLLLKLECTIECITTAKVLWHLIRRFHGLLYLLSPVPAVIRRFPLPTWLNYPKRPPFDHVSTLVRFISMHVICLFITVYY